MCRTWWASGISAASVTSTPRTEGASIPTWATSTIKKCIGPTRFVLGAVGEWEGGGGGGIALGFVFERDNVYEVYYFESWDQS